MAFVLTPKQTELLNLAASPARHVLAYGGSRSGKTFGFCYCVAARALQAPNSRHLIARRHNIDVRQAVLMDTWPKMMRLAFPGVTWKPNMQDQFATLATEGGESQVWFGGLDDAERVEKILGKEFATIYANECSQLPYDTITTLRTRLAQNIKKSDGRQLALKCYYDLNPVGRAHWSYIEFVLGRRVDKDRPTPVEPGSRTHIVINPPDNPHLGAEYLRELEALPERRRQRFLEGQFQSEVPGALWSLESIDLGRVRQAPDLKRIVVAVDPSGSDGTTGDSQGIIVAGLGVDGHGYILADRTVRMGPEGWGQAVVNAYHEYDADTVVAETNFGGAMVRSTIQTVDRNVPVLVRRADGGRGKAIRAEPVAALYAPNPQGVRRVHHVGRFVDLEDQMLQLNTAGYQGSGSPDRCDAMVWAISELMLAHQAPVIAGPRVVTAPWSILGR